MRVRGDCHSENSGKTVLVRVRGDCLSESKKNCHIEGQRDRLRESKRILYYVEKGGVKLRVRGDCLSESKEKTVLVRVRKDRLSESKWKLS